MSGTASNGPPRPGLRGAFFVTGGQFEVRALAELVLRARSVPRGEPIWVDISRAKELEPAAVVGLAHWVLRVRGRQVHVLGLREQRGDHWVARRSRARA